MHMRAVQWKVKVKVGVRIWIRDVVGWRETDSDFLLETDSETRMHGAFLQ